MPDNHVSFERMIMDLSPGTRVAMACRMFSTGLALVKAGLPEAVRGRSADLRPPVFLKLYGRELDPRQIDKVLRRFVAT